MRSGNPVFTNSALNTALDSSQDYASNTMTLEGTCTKTGILLALCAASGVVTWQMLGTGSPLAGPLIFGGAVVGFILALVTVFKSNWVAWTAPLYALAEGLFLGGISRMYESLYQGIVLQAVTLTFATLFALLIVYRMGWVKVNQQFRAGVMAATGAIMLVYLLSFVLSFFGSGIPYIHGSGMIGIGFSVFVIIIASLNLILDFDMIDRGVSQGWPKQMEWYGAFGLMVTLVWLYLEILRLLAKLNRRN